ncbi:MAG: bifunctional nuclease family protein [Spirochaetaceae bacterium]|jgi:bifunctional DNase/RNase|nr:bifunctional nuclease family protein [Spirochaetaceae bacterium]
MAMLEGEIWGIAETGDGYMVFIRPLDSSFAVPIFIGQLEAQAILIGFGKVSVSRPLTADLLLSLAGQAKFDLLRTEITEIKDNTFFARLVFNTPGGEIILDARPSDALALTVRRQCPLYIAGEVVEDAGVLTDELTGPAPGDQEIQQELLKTELDEAVAAENYERAAEIRDMLKLLKKTGENR